MKLRVTCCESLRSPRFIFLIDRIHCDAEPLLYFFTFFAFSNPTPPAYTHATLLAYCLLVAYCSRWYPLTIPLRCFSFRLFFPDHILHFTHIKLGDSNRKHATYLHVTDFKVPWCWHWSGIARHKTGHLVTRGWPTTRQSQDGPCSRSYEWNHPTATA